MASELDHYCPNCGEERTFYRTAATNLHLGLKTKWGCPECSYGFIRTATSPRRRRNQDVLRNPVSTTQPQGVTAWRTGFSKHFSRHPSSTPPVPELVRSGRRTIASRVEVWTQFWVRPGLPE